MPEDPKTSDAGKGLDEATTTLAASFVSSLVRLLLVTGVAAGAFAIPDEKIGLIEKLAAVVLVSGLSLYMSYRSQRKLLNTPPQ